MQFLFADYTLDADQRELRCGAERVTVEPQVLDLLIYLLQNHNRVVSKDDLIASVWGGRIVSDGTVISRTYAARKAIGDTGQEQTPDPHDSPQRIALCRRGAHTGKRCRRHCR